MIAVDYAREPLREFTASGGLISYGANITAAFRLLGTYAGRVLNGEKPGDLPILRRALEQTLGLAVLAIVSVLGTSPRRFMAIEVAGTGYLTFTGK